MNNDSLAGDFYFLGRGMTKKCLGIGVDNHNMYIALSDTPTYDLTKPFTGSGYARVPCAQLRYLKTDSYRNNRRNFLGCINPVTFSTLEDTLSLAVDYWKSENSLCISFGTSKLVIFKEPYTVLYTSDNVKYSFTHYSLDDDFQIADGSYTGNTSNSNYSSNYQLGYAMSYNPFHLRGGNNFSMWESTTSANSCPTSILCHRVGVSGNLNSTAELASPATGITADGCAPTISPFLFPRIANNELYIKKMYVPMTYPAVTSPVKIGYTPGKLNADNVYNLNDKYYLCLTNGVIGLFVEVADQGD
ncbi:MAG: hypothetical protein J6I35_09330 [Ruminobacter sp.]|uniref:hypothetical protein n=1 Tax=Ruminobacter sp. TaxID=2774296 RepID=UPI001B5E116C|nr:hypothetical protein [Ruminobacter sp.]MBP3749723.1 hypothetical protein [Ruminobacter sp.]